MRTQVYEQLKQVLEDSFPIQPDQEVKKISEEAERVGYKSFGEPRRCDEARVLRCET